jgi:DUF1680 family protein
MPMPIERIEANPKVRMDCGKVALQRGPLVYCLEEADNGKNLAGISLPRSAPLKTTYDRSLLGGTVVITGPALRRSPEGWDDALYRPLGSSRLRPFTLKGIPYCLRANRKVGEMVVWFREG